MPKPRIPTVGRFVSDAVEPLLNEVHREAFQGALPLIKGETDIVAFMSDPKRRLQFFQAAHHGFHNAQEAIADRILHLEGLASRPQDARNEIALLRKVMDGVAWQIIQSQLYIARRLYRDTKPPRLAESNFASVRTAARQFTSKDYSAFALISDLTTFVHVGDLLIVDASAGNLGLTIAEVKEGEKNKKIMDFMQFYSQSRCERSVKYFLDQEGPKVADQMMRMTRQVGRMAHVTDVIKSGKGRDPDSGLDVKVLTDDVPMDSYDPRLEAVIDASKERGWAIDVLEGGLFIGAYRGHMLRAAGPAFYTWMHGAHPKMEHPTTNLLSCMLTPLALPLFCRGIRLDQVSDLLFGRCAVILGLHLDEFISYAGSRGISGRWSSKKEAGRFQGPIQPFKVNNRALVFERDGKQEYFSDGMLVRIFFHGMPVAGGVDMIEAFLREEDNAAE